nr:YigZ family protein [Salinarchaeum sp. Harcht-Bsk1]
MQGSEFIGYVAPVESEQAADDFLAEIEAEYADATHVVPAYRVRTDEGYLREYSSDDGEPSGSAGKPALNVLQGQDLENVAVAVVRYYGGTNLGVGGLVSAYGRATKEAIEAAGVEERLPQARFSITVEYDDSGAVRSVLESADSKFDAAYEERVSFEVTVPVGEAAGLRDRIRSTTSGRAEIE